MEIKANGVFETIQECHLEGKSIYGVCGGFQMMGESVEDPFHVESNFSKIKGLGILPIQTKLTQEKRTQQINFRYRSSKETCQGYEIHMGQTSSIKPNPLCIHIPNTPDFQDGYFLNSKTWGSYIHGIFDNPSVLRDILQEVGLKKTEYTHAVQFKDEQYNKLAKHLRENLDMSYIYQNLKQV